MCKVTTKKAPSIKIKWKAQNADNTLKTNFITQSCVNFVMTYEQHYREAINFVTDMASLQTFGKLCYRLSPPSAHLCHAATNLWHKKRIDPIRVNPNLRPHVPYLSKLFRLLSNPQYRQPFMFWRNNFRQLFAEVRVFLVCEFIFRAIHT